MPHNKSSIQRYKHSDITTLNNSLLVRSIEQTLILSHQVKAVAQSASIEIMEIKPRETQALLDEMVARWEEGSLF